MSSDKERIGEVISKQHIYGVKSSYFLRTRLIDSGALELTEMSIREIIYLMFEFNIILIYS